MDTVLDRLPPGSRVAVIRLRSLGDCVLTTPALALLKAHRPDLRIAVVVEDRVRTVFEGNPDVERILEPSAARILAWRPRLTLNLHGGTRSMVLTLASGARRRAGFGHHRFSFVYSDEIPRAQVILNDERTVHTAEHIASAMFWLGVPRAEIPRAKLVAGPATQKLRKEIGRGGAGRGGYAVLHPFASEAAKTWPAERFLAVAFQLEASGLEPIFLSGPGDDATPFVRFTLWNSRPMADVKSLIAGAQLFVGNDSGPAHLAAAFGVPVVALFGSTDPAIWGPWRTEARVLRSEEGIGGITVEQVMDAVQALKVTA